MTIKINNKDYNAIPFKRKTLNYIAIPVNRININEEGAKEFTDILQYYKKQIDKWDVRKMIRTKSGGICKSKLQVIPCYDLVQTNAGIEFLWVDYDYCFKAKFANTVSYKTGISGLGAYKKFREVCEQFNIDLDKFAVDNGDEIKKDIPTPSIEIINGNQFQTYMSVHHIDLNSSYMSGIAIKNPELAPVIEHIYNNRKSDPDNSDIYKAILTHACGYFQSQYCRINQNPYALANLSYDAITFNNDYIQDLIAKIRANGGQVLLTNTDGIWYRGEMYHDENEGNGLGKWKHDHDHVKFSIRSAGAYEYQDKDGYHPVVRGNTALDRVKPRSEWKWGDIYKAGDIRTFTFDDKEWKITINVECMKTWRDQLIEGPGMENPEALLVFQN